MGSKEGQRKESTHCVTVFFATESTGTTIYTSAGEELQMQNFPFATKDICIAPRLANLALKAWMV